jgi:hypothetical protein
MIGLVDYWIGGLMDRGVVDWCDEQSAPGARLWSPDPAAATPNRPKSLISLNHAVSRQRPGVRQAKAHRGFGIV